MIRSAEDIRFPAVYLSSHQMKKEIAGIEKAVPIWRNAGYTEIAMKYMDVKHQLERDVDAMSRLENALANHGITVVNLPVCIVEKAGRGIREFIEVNHHLYRMYTASIRLSSLDPNVMRRIQPVFDEHGDVESIALIPR